MKSAFSVLALIGVMGLFQVAQASDHPCQSITKECRAQGYATGSYRSSGQGIVKDCLEKVISGQTLSGVAVPFDTVSSCKSKWKTRGPASESTSSQTSVSQ